MTVVQIKWDRSFFKPESEIVVHAEANHPRYGWVNRGQSGVFGTRWVDNQSASGRTNDRMGRFLELCGSPAVQAVKNTYQRNTDYEFGARAGQLALFINNEGLKNDVRWRGAIATAPKAILDLLHAADMLRASAFGG